MLTHVSLWNAIDRLAVENNLSISGLARCAGLDPTTFNRSKRQSRDGIPHWPSMATIARVLEVTQTKPVEFFSWADDGRMPPLHNMVEPRLPNGYRTDIRGVVRPIRRAAARTAAPRERKQA